eukprot:9487904-Pyramimonas_sp.AAC.1
MCIRDREEDMRRDSVAGRREYCKRDGPDIDDGTATTNAAASAAGIWAAAATKGASTTRRATIMRKRGRACDKGLDLAVRPHHAPDHCAHIIRQARYGDAMRHQDQRHRKRNAGHEQGKT